MRNDRLAFYLPAMIALSCVVDVSAAFGQKPERHKLRVADIAALNGEPATGNDRRGRTCPQRRSVA